MWRTLQIHQLAVLVGAKHTFSRAPSSCNMLHVNETERRRHMNDINLKLGNRGICDLWVFYSCPLPLFHVRWIGRKPPNAIKARYGLLTFGLVKKGMGLWSSFKQDDPTCFITTTTMWPWIPPFLSLSHTIEQVGVKRLGEKVQDGLYFQEQYGTTMMKLSNVRPRVGRRTKGRSRAMKSWWDP